MSAAIEAFLDAFRHYSVYTAKEHLAGLDESVRADLLLNLIHFANRERDKLAQAKELAVQITRV